MSDSITLKVEPVKESEIAPGDVVGYVRMPIPLLALYDLYTFVEGAYGEGCVGMEKDGWLEVRSNPDKEPK